MAVRCSSSPLFSPPANPVRHALLRSSQLGASSFLCSPLDRRIPLPTSTNLIATKNHHFRKPRVSAERDVLVSEADTARNTDDIGVVSVHHVGLLCQNLEKSLDFYQNLLGLKINEARPHEKLPYRGAWLWVGSEMIHLMELPNPDPLTGRPEHGGRDRHACIAIRNVTKLKEIFDKAGISYTLSRSGRPAIFARDPDGNALEFTQVD